MRPPPALHCGSPRAAISESGRIWLGFISLVGYEFLPTVVREFRSAPPHVDVEMLEFPVMQQFEPLHNEVFDVAILRMPRCPTRWRSR